MINKTILLFYWLRSCIIILINLILKKKFIIGYYNLKQNPLSYNFLEFIIYLLLLSKQTKKKVKLYLFKNNYKSLPREGNISDDWRFNNIILQSLTLSKSFSQINIFDKEVRNFPMKSKFNTVIYDRSTFKNILSNINNINNIIDFNSENFDLLNKWCQNNELDKNKIVTLTIRTKKDSLSRNSNLDEWKKFYKYLINKNYSPVFIDDLEGPYKNEINYKKFTNCEPAQYNLFFRLYLYKFSKINYFVNTGPAIISNLVINNNYVYIKPLSNNDWTKQKDFDTMGFKKNENINYLNNKYFRKIKWELDKFESLKETFEEFEKFLKKN